MIGITTRLSGGARGEHGHEDGVVPPADALANAIGVGRRDGPFGARVHEHGVPTKALGRPVEEGSCRHRTGGQDPAHHEAGHGEQEAPDTHEAFTGPQASAGQPTPLRVELTQELGAPLLLLGLPDGRRRLAQAVQ